MSNQRTLEFQVELGLQAAQSQIEKLRTELQNSVKINSSSFGAINSSLEAASRQVAKLKGEMDSAFKTSAGSKRFLNDFDKLFNQINAAGARFSSLGLSEMIFPPEISARVNEIRTEMNALQADLKRIESGKIGKVFEDSSIDSIKQVRQVASELNIDLSKDTFQQFSQQIEKEMNKVQQQIDETTKGIEVLKSTANGATLSKDSILAALQGKNVAADVTTKVLSNKAGADKLRTQIADIYKGFGLDGLTSNLGLSVKANQSIESIFSKQEKTISDSADELKSVIDTKRKSVETAITQLQELGRSNRDPSGNVLNEQGKLDFIEKLKEQFNSIDFSERKKGEGIRAYINQIVEDLKKGAEQIDATSVSKEILDKINEALASADTKDVITDPKAFGDKVNNAITEVFGSNFSLPTKIFGDFKGSTVEDAFTNIINRVIEIANNTDVSDLEGKLSSLNERFQELSQTQATVSEQQQKDAESVEQSKTSFEGLAEALAKLAAERLGIISGDISKILGEEQGKAQQAKSALEDYTQSLIKMEGHQKSLSNVKMAVTRWMGFYQVLNLTKRAINDMKQHIQELDSVMTRIAVVTNMTQSDLWNQIGKYSEIARQYGVAIKGVYEVSQIYYQQGLNKGDVMGLTTETLKMARIAGIDYATAADYMTTAIRGFKLEMSDAAHVTDVFSNLAAHTASSTEELATAISKTAASAASVGSSFEATSAMMATMIATTRESATNIGTALKSIISRYGELKTNVTGIDEEGEEYSLNKVDKALQTIGISIHDAAGQFRDFDDVILELGEAWDTIDKNTQRYIATVMAGNRQQSRFLALVSNVEEYKRALELANDSSDTGDIQTLKTLDSIDAKIERMKVTIQEFYTSSGLQDLYKNILDTITNVISAANSLPKMFDKIPVAALAIGVNLVRVIKNVLKILLVTIDGIIQEIKGKTDSTLVAGIINKIAALCPRLKNMLSTSISEGITEGSQQGANNLETNVTNASQRSKTNALVGKGAQIASIGLSYLGAGLNLWGATKALNGMNLYGSSTSRSQDIQAGHETSIGAGLGILGDAASGAALGTALLPGWGTAIGAIVGGVKGLITNFGNLTAAATMLNESLARTIELDKKASEQAKEEATKARGEESELRNSLKKLSSLKEAMYNSTEAMEEYKEYMNQLSDSYPQLVSALDTSGDKIIEVTNLELALAQARLKTARATIVAAEAELKTANDEKIAYDDFNNAIADLYTPNGKFNITQIREYIASGGLINSTEFRSKKFSKMSDAEFFVNLYDMNHVNEQLIKGKNVNERTFETAFVQNKDKILEYIFSDQSNYLKTSENKDYVIFKEALTDLTKALQNEVSLAEITGDAKITSIEDINYENLSLSRLYEAIDKAKTWVSSNLNNQEALIQTLEQTAFNTKLEERVLSDAEKNEESKALADHVSLFSSLSKQLFKSEEKVTSDYNKEMIERLEKWILENESLATDLQSLDFNNIKNNSFDTISKVTKIADTEENRWLIEALSKKYMDATQQVRDDLHKAFEKNIFYDSETKTLDTENYELFKGLTDGIDDSIAPALFSKLQAQLVQYRKIKDEGYDYAADAYLQGLSHLYIGISQIDNEETLASVNELISSTDLRDMESLQKALDSLENMDNVPKVIKESLEELYNYLNTNIAVQAMQLTDKAGELAESVKKAFSNLGKGMEFDEVFKAAEAIYNDLTKEQKKQFNLTDLYKFDNDLGQWVITEDAISLQFENLTAQYAQTAEEIKTKAGLQLELLSSLYRAQGSGVANQQVFNSFVSAHNLTEDEAKVYQILLESWQNGLKEGQSYSELYQDLITSIEQIKDNDIVAAESILKNSAISFLASFDWSAIAGGSANEQTTKAQLTTLLSATGIDPNTVQEKVDALYSAALTADIEGMNRALEGTGYTINNATGQKIIKSDVEQYKNAIEEITNRSQENWSVETKNLITQLNLSGKDTNSILTNLYNGLYSFIGTGNYTLEEYNNDIAELTNKVQQFSKASDTINLLKDGFKLEEFAKYLNDYVDGALLENYFKDGQAVGAFEGLFEIDENGLIQIIEGKELEVLSKFNELLASGIDSESELWIDFIGDSIDQRIAKNAKNNKGKQIATQLKNLSSASVGDEINISKFTPEMKTALGVSADAETMIIESAERRDALLLLLETSIDNYSGESKDVLLAAYKDIKEQIKSKKGNKGSALSGIISKSIDRNTIRTYMRANGYSEKYTEEQWAKLYKYKYDEFTDTWYATQETLDEINRLIIDAQENSESDEYIHGLQMQAKMIAYELQENPMRNALINLLSSYENVSNDVLSEFDTLFTDIKIDDYVTEEKGVKKVDIERLKQDLGEEYQSYFDEYIAQIADSYIENASKIGDLLTSGTTSRTEMQGFQKTYSDLMGGQTIDFFYDSVLQAWTIDATKIRGYLEQVAGKLGLGESASQWVEDQIQALTVDNLDFSNYLSGTASQKDQAKLKHDLQNYFKAHNKDYMPYMGDLENWAINRTNNVLASIDKGGQTAINALKSIKGELTTEEIQNAYRAQIAPIKALYDQIDELQVGSIVATNQVKALTKAGFAVNADGVITAVGDLVEAYKSLYTQMEATGEATLAELNETMGKYLDNRDREQQAIDALSSATNMTYSQLAEIYTQAGIKLTEDMVKELEDKGIIKGLGGNKLMIQNFKEFAARMPWKEGSEEYIKAFKSYNDSLIEYDRSIEKSIVEEIKSITSAKPGDKINLTNFVSKLEYGLDTVVRMTGAEIVDGILTLTDKVDVASVTSQLLSLAESSVKLIPEEIAEITDAINEILTNIASLIKEGINGSLSNVNKQSLVAWGENNDLNLQFIQTAEGFKLTQESAIEVYNTLKKINAIQGKLVFDELNKSLQETNEHYKSISDIASRIAWIESESHPERAEQYAQELALAKEIYAVRSTTEDSSFSFMSNKIPGAQNNPINYFNNWAQAINTFNTALKTQGSYTKNGETIQSGFVNYQDWYNLVTEMNNIAALGGDITFAGETLDGSLEAAAALIEKGAASLVATNTGEIKVALSGMSLDFQSGADAFSGNVTEGIQALAHSQIEMLDGMIKLLETVVAMEKLGDIDEAKDGHINIGDLFPEFDITDQGVRIKAEKLDAINAFVAQAGDSLKDIVINNESLYDMIQRAQKEGLSGKEAENFTAIMDSLYQMYRSGDYNIDDIYNSIQQIMSASEFSGTVKLGDSTLIIEKGTTIIETKDGKYKTPDGTVYDNETDAVIHAALIAAGGDKETIDIPNATATMTIGNTTFTIKRSPNGEITYKGENGVTGATLEEYIHNYAVKDEAHGAHATAEEIELQLQLRYGIKKLDSFSYQSINNSIREELEQALSSGNQTQVDIVIDKYNVLSQLKGLTGEEISELLHLDNVKVNVENTQALEAINSIDEALDQLHDKTIVVTTINKVIDQKSGLTKTNNTQGILPRIEPPKEGSGSKAAGNIGLAKAKGTLMGELGPELVVSNGRYFIVGQNGPEMVNLADDAIIFNHMQTKALLEKGTSKGRGQAITSEQKAISYAKGNINGGPAKASASAALNALRQLRAEWQALAGLSAKDLASKGGGGGGGGKDATFIKQLERWYNWLQEIATLEEKINYEETKRSKIQSDFNRNGYEYYKSQRDTLKYLENEMAVQRDLLKEQEAYFEQRRQQLNTQSAFSSLYTFDENGQIKYKSTEFQRMAEMFGSDDITNKPYHEIKEQYDWLISRGFGYTMEYNSNGEKIEVKDAEGMKQALEAFWAKIEGDQSEMQDLHNSINDLKTKLLEEVEQQNEILKEMEDNQISLENRVLKAIEDSAKREIDELSKQKDAYKESTDALINGISDQLDKERKLYENQESKESVEKKRRRLAILQRSGGSASEINSLQSEIDKESRDMYFDKQQEQIDTIQEAADNQLKKLEEQIDLMNQTLEYQKENGLLWEKVYEQMAKTPEEITNFITEHDSDFWSKSVTNFGQETRQIKFEAEQWKAFTEEGILGGVEGLLEEIANEVVEERKQQIEEQKKQEAANTTPTEEPDTTAKTSGPEKKVPQYWTIDGLKEKYKTQNAAKAARDAEAQRYATLANTLSMYGQSERAAANNKLAAEWRAKKPIPQYSIGGMVDETGPAILHAKEGVLTASQTSILRNEILGNSPDSALNILRDIRAAWIDSSNGLSSINNDSSSIVIEHAEVNMKVEKLANGYDAAKAGDDVMREILNIARKTSAQNRVGR